MVGSFERASILANRGLPSIKYASFGSGQEVACFDVAAGLNYAYGTTLYGLRDRAQLGDGETLLVLGAGGSVGLSAVEIGKLMGARVIAAASTDAKLDLCRERGADETINYATEDLKERAKQLTSGNGVDVVYDCVGGAHAEQALRAIAWEGRFVVVGFTAGIPSIPMGASPKSVRRSKRRRPRSSPASRRSTYSTKRSRASR